MRLFLRSAISGNVNGRIVAPFDLFFLDAMLSGIIDSQMYNSLPFTGAIDAPNLATMKGLWPNASLIDLTNFSRGVSIISGSTGLAQSLNLESASALVGRSVIRGPYTRTSAFSGQSYNLACPLTGKQNYGSIGPTEIYLPQGINDSFNSPARLNDLLVRTKLGLVLGSNATVTDTTYLQETRGLVPALQAVPSLMCHTFYPDALKWSFNGLQNVNLSQVKTVWANYASLDYKVHQFFPAQWLHLVESGATQALASSSFTLNLTIDIDDSLLIRSGATADTDSYIIIPTGTMSNGQWFTDSAGTGLACPIRLTGPTPNSYFAAAIPLSACITAVSPSRASLDSPSLFQLDSVAGPVNWLASVRGTGTASLSPLPVDFLAFNAGIPGLTP